MVILFEEPSRSPAPLPQQVEQAAPEPVKADGSAERQIDNLQHELAATRDSQQSIIEELQASNEELLAANEEVFSTNEELQSTNEELQTAKEEIQTTNEELLTVNEELRIRNLEAAQFNQDLNNLLASVQLPIVMVGRDLRIRRFTPSAGRVFRLIPGDIDRRISDIQPELNVPDMEKLVLEVLDKCTSIDIEVQDRHGRWYLLAIRPYRTAENKIDGAVIVAQDIDALKEAQARVVQADRLAAIGQMSAGLAHESRNALQRSQASLEMLRHEVSDRPEATKFLDRLQSAQDDLVHLYEEVREYAAPVKLRRKWVMLNVLVHQAWDQLAPLREGRLAQFNAEVGAVDLACEVDPWRIGQVFRDILENSLLACRDPVQIDVKWREAEIDGRPALRIAIRNNGPPFTEEERHKIFNAFFTTRTHGTGLGMAIARRNVDAHGGWMAVGPDADRGAEIIITLPRGSP